MLNFTQSKRLMPAKIITAAGSERGGDEPVYGFVGAMAGFLFYWLAFVITFLLYGANALFLMLYTWPFFLALIPVSVLIGLLFSVVLDGRLWLMIPCIGLTVLCLFWLIFTQLTGW